MLASPQASPRQPLAEEDQNSPPVQPRGAVRPTAAGGAFLTEAIDTLRRENARLQHDVDAQRCVQPAC
jgi:hypothetical protein